MPTAKEMFEEFKEKERLYDVLIEIDWHFIPCVKITFCESGCYDHETYIRVDATNTINFYDFGCDVENLELLTKAIHQQLKELGWLDE